jgi:hypothetical protein
MNVVAATIVFVVAATPSLVGATAPSAEAVVGKLAASGEKIANLYVQLGLISKNVGSGGRVFQEFADEQEIWFVRESKRMRFKKGGDDQLFDHGKRVMRRRVKGDVREVSYDRPIEECLPAALAYCLYPAYAISLFDQGEVRERGAEVTLTGFPKGLGRDLRGEARSEFDVDVHRNVMKAVRSYDVSGKLVNEVRLLGAQRSGECWLPRQVQIRSFGPSSVAVLTYSLKALKVNSNQEGALELASQ